MQADGLKLLEISSDEKNTHWQKDQQTQHAAYLFANGFKMCPKNQIQRYVLELLCRMNGNVHKKGRPLNATFVCFQVSSARLPWQRALVLSPVTLETAMAGMQAWVCSVRICVTSLNLWVDDFG